jgi:hypothetical protein
MFLRLHIKGATLVEAYREIHKTRLDAKPLSEKSIRQCASNMLRRIKAKVDWPRLMESAGHGEIRLLRELDKRLNQQKTIVADKQALDVEDGPTRMRATELLADLLGKRKSQLEVFGPGGGPIPVQIIDDIPAAQEPKKQ